MKIAFYHPGFPGGGAERVTLDITKYLKKTEGEYEIHVLTQELNANIVTDEIKSLVKIIKLPDHGSPLCVISDAVASIVDKERYNIFVEVGNHLPDIRKIMDKYRCRLIFAHHSEPFWEKRLWIEEQNRRAERNLIKKMHWLFIRKIQYTIFGKAVKLAAEHCLKQYNDADAYTVLCEEYRQEFIRKMHLDPGKNKILAMMNPEYEVHDIKYGKKKQIIFVGRLTHADKRPDRLLDIWKMVQKKLPDWELLIIGDGPERDNLKNQAERLHLERLKFEGYRTDVHEFYRNASILCLVSASEGWGLCLTEAQANGVIPIALSCSGGVRQILAPSGTNGFLVKTGPGYKKRFAKTLLKVARMPEDEKMKIRQNAVKKSSGHSVDAVGKKWKELFDRLSAETIP